MSGSVTISSSGVPARLRSMPVHAVEVLVQRLAGVLFEVGAGQAHVFSLLADANRQPAALHHRQISNWLIW
jgi:hypothetical protein